MSDLGQNFLTDENIVKNMVAQLSIGIDEEIVEIGPGLGALTKEIVKNITDSNKFHAVEFDPRLVSELKREFGSENIEIVNANILDWLPDFETSKKLKVIGSLPYYITSPIIHSLIYLNNQSEICVLLIQKEVAQKITAAPPDASYFSSFVQTFYNTYYIETVDKTKFRPEPQVDGGIIKLTKKNQKNIGRFEIRKYEGFLHKAYSNPRKMLNKVFTQDELDKIGIEGDLRPQDISVEKWIEAYKILNK